MGCKGSKSAATPKATTENAPVILGNEATAPAPGSTPAKDASVKDPALAGEAAVSAPAPAEAKDESIKEPSTAAETTASAPVPEQVKEEPAKEPVTVAEATVPVSAKEESVTEATTVETTAAKDESVSVKDTVRVPAADELKADESQVKMVEDPVAEVRPDAAMEQPSAIIDAETKQCADATEKNLEEPKVEAFKGASAVRWPFQACVLCGSKDEMEERY